MERSYIDFWGFGIYLYLFVFICVYLRLSADSFKKIIIFARNLTIVRPYR
jgi:hypothetical protein